MATLQKIRSKGPLLLIVIGLAMLAFILGDAWKIIRPNQGIQYVGTIDGEDISAMDFQKELENYTEVVKFANQTNDLTEEQNNALRDEVWAIMVRNYILEKAAAQIGLTVTDEEVKEVIERGNDPVLTSTPFSQDGKFDADVLKSFLAFYQTLESGAVSAEEMNYYDSMYKYWLFIENDIKSGLLYSKYMALVQASIVSNPVAARISFDDRIKRADVLMASLPYSSLSDDEAQVTSSDLKKTYSENKEALYVYSENRDIYYIDYEIEPSAADRKALLEEVNEITSQLEDLDSDYESFVRRSGSEIAYSEVPSSAKNLPEDVAARLDSVNKAGVYGPYYNEDDDTYNTFKILAQVNGYDSIQFTMIQVPVLDSQEEADKRADSICTAASKRGADFAEIASKYNQTISENWLSANSYEPAVISGDNAVYINKLNSMKKGEVAVVKLTGANLVLQVLDTKTPLKKYDIAIVKRPVDFSEETSNAAYNKLSQFVAQNSTLEELKANAEDSDFRLLYYPAFENYNYNVAGVSKSHEALRWAFGAQKGEVSRIFEVGAANDHLLVVAVSDIHPRGYRSVEDAAQTLSYKALKDKKAAILTKKMAGLSMDEVKALPGAVVDTVNYVNFSNSAYIASMSANEAVLGASVANLETGVMTAPIKGDNCVFVAQKLSEENPSSNFDEAAEKLRLKTLSVSRIPGSVIETLYFEAKVIDNRYKIF